MIAAVVLAAGQATRMGRTKQLLPVGGRPMLQHAIDAASEAGVDEILVVLGHDASRVAGALHLPDRARVVVNPEYASGQASSLRAGLAAASPDMDAALILLGDEPSVSVRSIRAVVDCFTETGDWVVRTAYGGRPGHPVLLARGCWSEVAALEGDIGARELIARHPDWTTDVELDESPPPDIDTPEQYERLVPRPPVADSDPASPSDA